MNQIASPHWVPLSSSERQWTHFTFIPTKDQRRWDHFPHLSLGRNCLGEHDSPTVLTCPLWAESPWAEDPSVCSLGKVQARRKMESESMNISLGYKYRNIGKWAGGFQERKALGYGAVQLLREKMEGRSLDMGCQKCFLKEVRPKSRPKG